MSLGACRQSNLATRRARVLSMGRPPTSVGQAKKSDSTTPCSPVLLRKSRAMQQVGGVGLRQPVNVDAEGCLYDHADDGAQVGVADEQVVHLVGIAGDLAQGRGEQVLPELPLDPDGVVAGVLVVQGLEDGYVALVGGAIGSEVLGDGVPGGLLVLLSRKGVVAQPLV